MRGATQQMAAVAVEVRFVKGRLAFTRADGEATGAPFPSTVIVLQPGLEQIEHEGQLMTWTSLWDVPSEVRR